MRESTLPPRPRRNGVVHSQAVRALEGGSSTTKQILIDQDLRGWKEVEYEARGRRPFDLPMLKKKLEDRAVDATRPRPGTSASGAYEARDATAGRPRRQR